MHRSRIAILGQYEPTLQANAPFLFLYLGDYRPEAGLEKTRLWPSQVVGLKTKARESSRNPHQGSFLGLLHFGVGEFSRHQALSHPWCFRLSELQGI